MPPWSVASKAKRPSDAEGAASSTTPTPGRGTSRTAVEGYFDQASSVPTLHFEGPPERPFTGDGISKLKPSKTRNGHGRSMSHPFPSLFSSKKRHEPAVGRDSTDEEPKSPQKANSGNGTRAHDTSLLTGKCMTCDSTVRWPKDLSVFRCVVCLTINDLKPVEARPSHGMEPARTAEQWKCLSIDHATIIIEKCIASYLISRLTHTREDSEAIDPDDMIEEDQFFLDADTQNLVKFGDQLLGAELGHQGRHPIAIAGTKESEGYTSLHGRKESMPMRLYSTSTPENFASSFRSADIESPVISLNGAPTRAPPPPPIIEEISILEQQVRYLELQLNNKNRQYDAEEQKNMTQQHRLASLQLQRLRDEKVDSPPVKEDSRPPKRPVDDSKTIFKPLEEYLITSFSSRECINKSFSTARPELGDRAVSDGPKRPLASGSEMFSSSGPILSTMDAKTLLIGDIAENGSWWSGTKKNTDRSRSYRKYSTQDGVSGAMENGSARSPRIDWATLNEWYNLVIYTASGWKSQLENLLESGINNLGHPSAQDLEETESWIMGAQAHVQRVLLKATETLLKRPGPPMTEPDDLRFLLIILANPLLYPPYTSSLHKGRPGRMRAKSRSYRAPSALAPQNAGMPPRDTSSSSSSREGGGGGPGQHSGITKRILGLLSNLPNECHHHLVTWFSKYPEEQFQKTVELIGSFVTYRLTRQDGRQKNSHRDPTAGLVPNMSASGPGSSASLMSVIGLPGQSTKQADGKPKPLSYNDDWQIKAAARVMALLFSANNNASARRHEPLSAQANVNAPTVAVAARETTRRHGQILATSDFYNSLLDYFDLVADFEAWETKRGRFAFCQYPFFLSIWAKIKIMEHDAKRQMEVKAREAFFDSIMTRRIVQKYLVLQIRRECLVEDSLKGVSEVVGTGSSEIKKGLRIEFKGEEGIDAGGLRKEWFLLLVRDVFNPEHGMFVYDEDSQYCYFNPQSFETSDQFFLVGVVLGLAIYNSTILDVALPPFAFRKLITAAPNAGPGLTPHTKSMMIYTLEDLAEFRPTLAHGLRQLLEYGGDVESTFCRDFVADVERYGQVIQVPLCENGDKRPVTSANRREFVDLYVKYLLEVSVARQFEPFKRGFFTVCGGNALSLFRPEEIELLIRGSDESLDISALRAVSIYENWGVPDPAQTEEVVQWFWESFRKAEPKEQRKLLSFITGSDRIPAMGAANLVIKLSCLGENCERYPVARTCFNVLSLYRYSSRDKLERMLWRAVHESEGFGLK